MAHGETYAVERGWDPAFEALVARIVADFAARRDPAREAGWIAELDGRRVGCVLCTAGDDGDTARLRTLLVAPEARGRGTGALLVDTCLAFARDAGYRRIELWTYDVLAAAGRIYRAAGFELVRSEPDGTFGVVLESQIWARAL